LDWTSQAKFQPFAWEFPKMSNVSSYGDISPAVAAWANVQMLKRAVPYLQIEQFGQTYPLPTNSTQTAKFRR
jgi:hypothetical protein